MILKLQIIQAIARGGGLRIAFHPINFNKSVSHQNAIYSKAAALAPIGVAVP
ncbi:hypothetical protein [Brasilonema bromeliae]|uniref:hypothetical protein n=1 Tax=Brasilonema bromeliae TaxID=383615 RepID=UPI00145E2315|nr:hypothetical protein [Brasilonema bromeliae]